MGYTINYIVMLKEFINLPIRPTAIFAMNDLIALGIIEGAAEIGLEIPRELSVLGFDDRECGRFSKPKLSTIGLPLKKMGYEAAKAIHKQSCKVDIENKQLKFSCNLIQRQSTGQAFQTI